MPDSRVSIGVSLKMYFGPRETEQWCARVAQVARDNRAVQDGSVELFVIPGFLSIPAALSSFAGTGVRVGAQDVFWEDRGAFTGEISGADLVELGCSVVEVGHAERRRLFAETEEVVAAKSAAALRNRLTPVLCIGEFLHGTAEAASIDSVAQLRSALASSPGGRVIVAYEPVWAIGASHPADTKHIQVVCAALRQALDSLEDREGSVVVYGGSAGPGLLDELQDDVDGLFLGRFAHDPSALGLVLDEAAALAKRRAASAGATS